MCKTSDDDIIDKEIGRRIKNLRIKRSASQKDLGDVLGVTYQQVQRYETGKNTIALSKLIRLADFFKVSIMEFIGGFASIDGQSRFLPNMSSSIDTELVHIYHAIEDPVTRSAFLNIGRSAARADFGDD